MTDNREIITSYGTVRNINKKKLKKRKMYRTRILALASASIMFLTGFIAGRASVKKDVPTVPEDKVITTISVEAESGDVLESIAKEYYNKDYNSVYSSLGDYTDAIAEQNNIENPDKLDVWDKLEIPVIVDENNEYYLRKLEIQNKISNIEENNLWVLYTIKAGDNISSLASLASGSISETYSIVDEIASKNGISKKSMLNLGQEIWIMNPELGKLKTELNEVEEQFKESLTVTQTKK